MRILSKRWTFFPLVAMACVLTAANATAGGFPGSQPPDVFSDDFGVMLADDLANGASVLDHINEVAGDPFPWGAGFEFPAESPPLPPAAGASQGLGGGVGAGGNPPLRSPVPEPEPAILMALGLVTLGLSRRFRTA